MTNCEAPAKLSKRHFGLLLLVEAPLLLVILTLVLIGRMDSIEVIAVLGALSYHKFCGAALLPPELRQTHSKWDSVLIGALGLVISLGAIAVAFMARGN